MNQEQNSIISQNERESNRFIAKTMRICMVVFTLILVLNIAGIFIITMNAMVVCYILGMILLFIPTLLVNILKLYHPFFKYLFVTISIVFVFLLTVTLNWHAIVMFIFGIAVANMYYSKALNIYAIIMSIITLSIAQVCAYFTGFTLDRNMYDVYSMVVYCIFPRAISLCAVGVLFSCLNSKIRKMLGNLLDADAQTKMMDQMKKMQDQSGEMSVKLTETVHTLTEVTGNTSKNNTEISERAGLATSASEQTLEQIDSAEKNVVSISENLSRLADGTNELSRLSSDVRKLSDKNKEQMNQAMSGFSRINESTKESKEKINELESKSQEIAQITSVITGISSRTNLLALNASIESARAGEAGKGFAVVAEQIRQLAEQTQSAVADIGVIVEQVINSTNEAVKAMDESEKYVVDGMEIITGVEQSSNQVMDASEQMNAKIDEIDTLTKDAASYSEKIVSVVDNVKSISEQSLDELHKVSGTSEMGLKDVKQLEELVEKINKMSVSLSEVIAATK